MLTRADALRMAFERDSRVDRTPVGIRAACVEQAALLVESWWQVRASPKDARDKASYRWVAYQTLCHVLLWKFSEAFSTDKRLGAPFWSEGAIKSLQKHKQVTTPAWFKSQGQPVADALVHEHVCERARLADWLLGPAQDELAQAGRCDRTKLAAALVRLCVGCVVTHAEHKRLDKVVPVNSDWQNPWGRYSRAKPEGILVVPNPRALAATDAIEQMSDDAVIRRHHGLLSEAGVYAPQETQ